MTREQLLKEALQMAREIGLINLSRRNICDRAGISDGSFSTITGNTFPEFVAEVKTLLGQDVKQPAKVQRGRAIPELRREQLLDVAFNHAVEVGFFNIARGAIAEAAGVSPALVNKHLGTLPKLKRAIMREAIRRESVALIAQGLAGGDAHAKKAPPELKERAIRHLSAEH